jgi:hypothetical protein
MTFGTFFLYYVSSQFILAAVAELLKWYQRRQLQKQMSKEDLDRAEEMEELLRKVNWN